MFRKSRKTLLIGGSIIAAATLALSACTTPATKVEDKAMKATGGSGYTFAVITHASPGDIFWDVVKTGAEDAGKILGVKVTYQGSGEPQEQAQLIEAAVAQKVDGIAVTVGNPDGLKSAIEKVKAAGIPFVTLNAGLEQSQALGAITHVGQDEKIAGEDVGKKLSEASLKNVICVVHSAGVQSLEQRCAGAAKTFTGTVKNIQVDINNVADAQNTIKSALLADPSIDGVLSLNPAVAVAAASARDDAKSSAKVSTFDVSSDVLKLIEEGKILFAVDQQQYLQGYLPIVFLNLYKDNGNTVGGGQPVYSGPGYVTKENAAQITKYAANGKR